MSERTENIKTAVIIALTVIIIVGMFLYTIEKLDSSGSLKLKTGENELEIKLSGNKLNFRDLIDNLFNDERSKKDALAILRDSYALYHKNSELLVDQIRKESGETDFAKHIRGLLIDLKGPFERKYHSYYDVTDIQVVDAINKLEYDHDVAKKFRYLRDHAEGVFEPRGIDVDVAFYLPKKIYDGNAAVCKNSKHRGRDFFLLNPNNLVKTLRVKARNYFPCIKKSDGAGWEKPLIQVNLNDGRKLFGGKIILGEKKKAIMYPAR